MMAKGYRNGNRFAVVIGGASDVETGVFCFLGDPKVAIATKSDDQEPWRKLGKTGLPS
jgi:hypothetical protein